MRDLLWRGSYSRGLSSPLVRWLLPLALSLGCPSLAAADLPSIIQRIVDKREVTNEEDSIYKTFKTAYEKYFDTQEDDDHHEVDFVSNLRFIEEFNRELGRKCTLKITELTDLNITEFQQQRLGLLDIADDVKRRLQSDPDRQHQPTSRSLADLPDSVDWERAGAVTSVKNQKSCGSCFAFATVAAIEGAWKVAGGPLLDLSAQQVLDCTYKTKPYPSNMGCNGGYISSSLEYLSKTPTCTWSSYPYSPSYGAVGSCKSSTCTQGVPLDGVTGWNWVSRDMMHLMDAVSKRPVTVAIASSSSAFQNYGYGIITARECGTKVDHAVLLVGYGTDSGTDYWRIKNTWGSSWGENGYVRIERGAGGSGGCGILSQPAYPNARFTGYIPAGYDSDSSSPTPAPAPAPPPSSSDDDDDDSGSSGGSTAAIIIGSVIGGIVLLCAGALAVCAAVCLFCLPGAGEYETMLVSVASSLGGGPDSSTSQQLFQFPDDCEASDANE